MTSNFEKASTKGLIRRQNLSTTQMSTLILEQLENIEWSGKYCQNYRKEIRTQSYGAVFLSGLGYGLNEKEKIHYTS